MKIFYNWIDFICWGDYRHSRSSIYADMGVLRFLVIYSILVLSSHHNIYANVANIGSNYDWHVYKTADGTKYMISYPKKEDGNFKKRARPYIMVASYQDQVVEVTIYSGYHYKQKSKVDVSIKVGNGGTESTKKFHMYVNKDMAWNEASKSDLDMIDAMRSGNSVTVYGISTKGTFSSDTYSLHGFDKSYKLIIAK